MKNFNSETELIAWPVDWNKRSRLACFFSPVPFVGDDWKLHKNANKILCNRDKNIIAELWHEYDFSRKELFLVFNLIKFAGNWSNTLFHPQDTFSLLVCKNYLYQDADYDVINEIFTILTHEKEFYRNRFVNLLYKCGDLPVVEIGKECSLIEALILLKSCNLSV